MYQLSMHITMLVQTIVRYHGLFDDFFGLDQLEAFSVQFSKHKQNILSNLLSSSALYSSAHSFLLRGNVAALRQISLTSFFSCASL